MTPPPAHLSPRVRRGLARTVTALEAHTEAPLRVLAHTSAPAHEVFDMREEFERGPRGRRFLVSVTASGDDALVVPADTEDHR